jgi:glycosyltransferase involved in cell wall biosynthesis
MRYRGQPKDEVRDGVRLHRVWCIRKKMETCETPEMMTYVLSALYPAIRLCSKMQPHVIHCHFAVPTGLLAWMVHRVTGVPYIVTVHGSDLPGHNTARFVLAHRFTRPLLRRVLSSAARIVSPSHFLAEHLRVTCGPYNVNVIANGIEYQRFSPGSPNRRTAVLMSGRLLKPKGFVETLEALSQVPGDFEVHVAGDGPMRADMERIAARMKQKVVFHGWLDSGGGPLKDLYETCSIFALPSERENAPISLLEAMSAGMAIVTSDGSGCRETAGDCGVLVPPHDVPALTEALRELLSSPERVRERGAAARRRVEQRYGWHAIGLRYLDVLQEAASIQTQGPAT